MKIENLRDIEQGEASNLKMLEKFIELNDLVTVEKGSKKLPYPRRHDYSRYALT